jgi:hypothetical protein
MSRTDKTNPYFVKWFYEPLYLEEQHNHENHECNLPPKPTVKEAREKIGWTSDDCQWYPSFVFMRSKDARCSCYMCGYDAYCSVTRRKRQRIDARNYCRDGWMEEY